LLLRTMERKRRSEKMNLSTIHSREKNYPSGSNKLQARENAWMVEAGLRKTVCNKTNPS